MEVLPLTVVNLIQKSDSIIGDHGDNCTGRHATGELEAKNRASYVSQQNSSEQFAELTLESDSDSSEDSDDGSRAGETMEDEFEFGNTEFEELVLSEGPQQILQLMLQDKAADFMNEEVTDDDDYADWIQWAADAERQYVEEGHPGRASALQHDVDDDGEEGL